MSINTVDLSSDTSRTGFNSYPRNRQNSEEILITRNELAQITAQRLFSSSYGSINHAGIETGTAKMSPERRTFCLFVTFDLVLTFIVWVIYSQSTGIKPFSTAIINEISRYTFTTSLFDLVLCSASRFVPLMLAYCLFRLNHPWVVAVTTFLTCTFLVAKAFMFDFNVSHRSAISYASLLISFTVAWIETWMMDFKVIPKEQRTYAKRSDDELEAQYRSTTQKYQKLAKDSWTLAKEIYDKPHMGWKRCNDMVASKNIKPYGKIYKLQTVINCSLQRLFNILFENIEDTPTWNNTVLECKRLKSIDDHTDIIYVLAAEAAGGMVSCRDFVNLTHWKQVGNSIMSSCVGVDFHDMPVSSRYVRAQNKPAMIVITPIDEHRCHFTWFLNIDLKGWLPKSIVEQALATSQIEFVRALNIKVNTHNV